MNAPPRAIDQLDATSKKRWDKTVEINLAKLGKRKDTVKRDLDHATFDLYLKELLKSKQSHGMSSIVVIAEPVLHLLDSFAKAIGSMAQTDQTALPIWGVTQAVFKVPSNVLESLKAISDMIEDLVNSLPRFGEYERLFPEAHELNEPLRELYDDYVGFCVNAAVFLRSKRLGRPSPTRWPQSLLTRHLKTPMLMPFSSNQPCSLSREGYLAFLKEFNEIKAKIKSHTEKFQMCVDIAHTRLARKANDTVVSTHHHVLALVKRTAEPQTMILGMQFARNPRFQGRDQVLLQFHQNVQPWSAKDGPGTLQKSCVLHGIGGVGKTQVASEYVYRFKDSYKHICWARAKTGPEMAKGFHDFAQELIMPHQLSVNQSGGSDVMKAWFMNKETKEPGKLQRTIKSAIEIVRRSFPAQSATQGPPNQNWAIWKEYLPHVLSLQTLYAKRQDTLQPTPTLATLLMDAGMYLWETGLTRDGIETLEIDSLVYKRMEDDNEIIPVYANICSVRAVLHGEIGYSGRSLARVAAQEALALRQRRVCDQEAVGVRSVVDYLLLSNGWNDLGVMLMQNEEFGQARPAIKKALATKEEWIDEDNQPQKFGESYKNLAYIRLYQGLVDEARDFGRRAHILTKKANGERSQAALKGKFVYGCVLLGTGDMAEAKRIHKEVLASRKDLYGPDHHLVRDSVYTLGEIYRLFGKYDKAEQFFREALREPESAQSPARFHLALLLRTPRDEKPVDKTRLEEAQMLEEEAAETKDSFGQQLTD
ncbi:hypothetical protein B0H67DRAFT_642481 [Lasiosphaeris hirsuta]|uniref:NB-ARC domain-containing protein n=1 Tax=Lasiosphaeris hirsuta TaxID=260670 RepID=A0AA40B1Z8_9PEZI|nr:hypothetical protein B0H67DRAFT_642481 [Lasiosphaeris hirsuta]